MILYCITGNFSMALGDEQVVRNTYVILVTLMAMNKKGF